MPLYKEQGVVLRSMKLGEADRIVTLMTQGEGKVRAVAKGIRKTTSRFGARLEPLTHVSLMCYRGRGDLDTVSQAEIVAPFRAVRDDLALIAEAETMVEAVDRVAQDHERNVRLFLLLLGGLRALDARPADPELVAQSFLLKLLSLSGFHATLTACAACGRPEPTRFSSPQGGAVCANCAEGDAEPVDPNALAFLAALGDADLADAGAFTVDLPLRRTARSLLFAFAEYHVDRRLKSLPMLSRSVAR
ncbi:MAG: DNA repair protein RecO [Actinomycetota bacterium]